MGQALDAVERMFSAFTSGDEQATLASFTDDTLLNAPGVLLRGPAAVTEYMIGWAAAFPGRTIEKHLTLENDTLVAQRITFSGIQSKDLVYAGVSIPATNRLYVGGAAEVFRVEDGKVAEQHLYFDQVELLGHLGLLGDVEGVLGAPQLPTRGN
ncbi:hypothetical protein JCM18899A_31780 [Nocardioides sp. AN3]